MTLTYDPAGHDVHVVAPVPLYCPAPQATGVTVPLAHWNPEGQVAVQDADGLAVVLPYRPAWQLVQVALPVKLYLPGGHATAVELLDPAGHMYPAWHGPLHDAFARAEMDPYKPAVQFVQAAAPGRLYCPGGHAAWVADVEPARHA